MINNKIRIGNFTSSEIVALTTSGKEKGSLGKPALTYIAECNMERRLMRSLTTESNARPLVWGKFMESRVFDLLGMEYTFTSKSTKYHPDFDCWGGSADGTTTDTVYDIKCPITLKSFCEFADCKTIGNVRDLHKDGEKYYWQLVSNSIIENKEFAELIFYVPYKSEIPEIKQEVNDYIGDLSLNSLAWINFAEENELPYLPDNGYYKNITKMRFKVSESDKEFLTDRVKRASKLLVEHYKSKLD